MVHFVYILANQNKENWSYVGSTDNVQRRFLEHCAGKVRSTKGLRPLQLIHVERFDSKENAYKRELYLKSGFGREEKKEIIKHSGIV